MEFFNKTEKGYSIDINDEIGGWWGISHQQIKSELDASEGSDIQLNISSLGGDVNHAFAIYNLLKSHSGRVVANIYGDAASAATLIALGADEVRMAENVFFMIHNVWTMAVGDSGELRKTADLMDKFNDQIKDLYKKKTGLNKNKITSLMNNETWFTAKEAKEHGFIDTVVEASEVLNRSETVIFNSMNKELAKELINKINNKNSKQMELNEEKVADSIFAKIKNLLSTEEKTVEKVEEVKEEKQEMNIEEMVKNAVASAIEPIQKENEALKTQLAEKDAKIENKAKEVEKLAEEAAQAKANKTEVENKVDSADVDSADELAYAGAIRNLVKKVKQIN